MGKTIAQELFTIAEAQGGTASGYPHTIAGAVDALTDALAGSDVDSGRTIAEAVAVMGEYIGGGGGSATMTIYLAAMDVKQNPSVVTPLECDEVTVNNETAELVEVTVTTPVGEAQVNSLTVAKGDLVFALMSESVDNRSAMALPLSDPEQSVLLPEGWYSRDDKTLLFNAPNNADAFIAITNA